MFVFYFLFFCEKQKWRYIHGPANYCSSVQYSLVAVMWKRLYKPPVHDSHHCGSSHCGNIQVRLYLNRPPFRLVTWMHSMFFLQWVSFPPVTVIFTVKRDLQIELRWTTMRNTYMKGHFVRNILIGHKDTQTDILTHTPTERPTWTMDVDSNEIKNSWHQIRTRQL